MPAVLLSNDLTVLARVEGVAARFGKTVRVAGTPSQAIERCAAEQADLLIIDLSSSSLDLAALVKSVKSNRPFATHVLAFGPHVHEERLAAARNADCDLVVSRGEFFSQLDTLLGP